MRRTAKVEERQELLQKRSLKVLNSISLNIGMKDSLQKMKYGYFIGKARIALEMPRLILEGKVSKLFFFFFL